MRRRRRPARALLGLLLTGVLAQAQSVPWAVEESGLGEPQAVVVNDGGDRLALFLDGRGGPWLEFTAGGAFEGLSPATCPTIQVDRDLPLHHYAVGARCRIEGGRAVLAPGDLRGRTLQSTLVHQIMQGDDVHVRYVTADDAYHEASFPLSRSAAAIRRALGRGVRVRPE